MTRATYDPPLRLPGAALPLRVGLLLVLLASAFPLCVQPAAVLGGGKDEKKELKVILDENFKKLRLGALPKGWDGEFGAMDDKGTRCLESTKKSGVQLLKLPRMSLKGDFVIECEFILDEFAGNGHELHLRLENARGETVTLKVNAVGGATLQDGQVRRPAEFKQRSKSRLRFACEEGVYGVQLNGMDVTGARLPEPKGPFVAVHIGVTAGVFNSFTAKLYSLKISGEEGKSSGGGGGGVVEDFGKVKVGALPQGWNSAGARLSVQVDGERRQLELAGQMPGVDFTQLPPVTLKGDFYLECTFVLRDTKTSVAVQLAAEQPALNLVTNGDKLTFLQTPKGAMKYDVSKALKERGQENLLRLERKDAAYLVTLNKNQVATMPTALSPGPFTTVRLGLGIAEKGLRSPVIRQIRVVPLDDAQGK
jgi:hypothetical protein